MRGKAIGIVLGTLPATPLEFWIGIDENVTLQLDDVIFTTSYLGNQEVSYYGVITEIQKYLEGSKLVYEAQLAKEGVIPVNLAYVAKVNVTRIEPEIFSPPIPGSEVLLAEGEEFEKALYFDQMENKIPAGLTRSGKPVMINYDFISGKEGAHVSISGMSGIATKTSYALFLLNSVMQKAPKDERKKIHALIFNVKGKDLLWLDKKSRRITKEDEEMFKELGLEPKPFKDVIFYVPPEEKKGTKYGTPKPDFVRQDDKVIAFSWTMREFAEEGLLKFMFVEGDEALSNLGYLIERVASKLLELAKESPSGRLLTEQSKGSKDIEFLTDLYRYLEEVINSDKDREEWFGKSSLQTIYAFMRRFERAVMYIDRFIVSENAKHIEWRNHKVSVVDISSLHNIAKMFVVGAVLKRIFKEKEDIGQDFPKIFVVLDELNKYAPKESWSPIKDIILDISERGRSLGVLLIGAQQTASEIEKRVIANAAIKVLGRVDTSEIFSKEYDFLLGNFKQRVTMLKKGTMVLYQPDIQIPLVIKFPKPPWATRKDEVEEDIDDLHDFDNH